MARRKRSRGRAYGDKVRAAARAISDLQVWLIRASHGGTRPCLQTIQCNDGEQVFKFGLDSAGEVVCPICSDIGIESVLYIEVVQSGLSGAGSRLGHCDSCWERDGVGLRQLDYWGLK